MKKLKIYLVDEGVYWCDFSCQDAYENYKKFALDESGFYTPPLFEYPKEVGLFEASMEIPSLMLSDDGLGEILDSSHKVGLLYCSCD